MTDAVSSLKNVLAKQEEKPQQSLQSLIQSASKELGRALPSHLSPDRLVRIALTSIRLNPELSKCTPESFLGSLFVLAQLGLEPVAGRCYLLPFNNRRKVGNEWKTIKEVQAIIGYKGYVDLFYRHDSALSIDVQTVREHDDFSYAYGTEPYLKHKPAIKNRGEVIGFYAVGRLKGGASLFRFMSAEEALEHGKAHSKTYDEKSGRFYDSSPWVKEFEAMAKKTCIIQLAKLLPLSVELQRALTVDETSRDFREGIDSALDLPVSTTWAHTPEEADLAQKNPPTAASKPKEPAKKQADPDEAGDANEDTFNNYTGKELLK
jgi:recombination protein RecT